LRRSHYGLFLRFGILFWFHSVTFERVIIISWCSVSNSCLEPCDSSFSCRNGWLAKRWTDFVCRVSVSCYMNLTLTLIYCWLSCWHSRGSLLFRGDLSAMDLAAALRRDVVAALVLRSL
jgi:hypothetical protein